MTSVSVGSVWKCKQDGRSVEVLGFTLSGDVRLIPTGMGRETTVKRSQFERRYRFFSPSRMVRDMYPDLWAGGLKP